MKSIKIIITYILSMILTICLISIGLIIIVSSTILEEDYVKTKLEETDFYHETYKLVISNFENYIYQSGLEEINLEDICTETKVKQDIDIIVSNIYEGTNKEIETNSIVDNLNNKIDNSKAKSSINKGAINKFIEQICDEYKYTLIHTNYENLINKNYVKIKEIIKKIQNIVIITTVINIIIIFILNIKIISKFVRTIGIALLASGIFEIIVCKIINLQVNIQGIKILNEAFSTTIVTIIQEIMSMIQSLGIISVIVSIICIIIYSVAQTKNEKIYKN